MKITEDIILENINRIFKEIDHKEADINIKEIHYDEGLNELWIIGMDRPDKSAIIGKGGWIVGRLKEDLDINSIHVESYTDFMQKEYRLKLSLDKVRSFQNTLNKEDGLYIPIENLKNTIQYKLENLSYFNLEKYLNENFRDNLDNVDNTTHKAVVALSGGVDSSFSLVLAQYLGFNPIAISVNPGTIVLPKQFRNNIDNICNQTGIQHRYIDIDYSELIKECLSGRIHPCGRCSKQIESTIFDYAIENNIPIVIFGDMLSTGSQCITDNLYNNHNIKRLNLPASLSCGKIEGKKLMKDYDFKEIKGFGCPLLYEVHRKYPHMRKYSIQRILRETRSGALEVGEALDLIWSFYKIK